MTKGVVGERQEVPTKFDGPSAWDLSELLPEPSQEVISDHLVRLEEKVTAFEGFRDRLVPELSREELLDILHHYESLLEEVSILAGYASLWFASDTQSPAALALRNRVQQALTQMENRTLFFSLWWQTLNPERAMALLPDPRTHADEHHFLWNLRRFAPYTLDERSEQLINLKDANGMDGLLTLYSILTNGLEYTLEIDGRKEVLTRDRLMSYAYSPRPELRVAAYQEIYRVYGEEATILGQIYLNRVRDWHAENVELRGFKSPVAVRNISNDIPDEAQETLLRVIRENAGLFHRYFRLKGRWLGLEKLRRYDLYAPIAPSEREAPYAEAVAAVLDTFRTFHPRFAELARRVFAENHIDSEIRKGKKGGAFCATVLPRFTPWVLVNYTGRVRDIAILAHELGHAVHTMLASNHSLLTIHPSLPLAETASVFAELLMTDRLLSEERDPLARRELLASAMDDVYATVLRQAYFVLFELEAHPAILEGASPEDLNKLYMANLSEQFRDSVEVAPEFAYEWLSIPHFFHTPFYCYAYSFGQLLVLALYRRFREEGEAFKPGYLRLLSYGGSRRPLEILREVGVNITDEDFWRGGFEVIRGMVTELEALPDP